MINPGLPSRLTSRSIPYFPVQFHHETLMTPITRDSKGSINKNVILQGQEPRLRLLRRPLFQILKHDTVSQNEKLLFDLLPLCYAVHRSAGAETTDATDREAQTMKKKMSPRKFGGIAISVTAVLLVLALVATGVMNYWSTVMDAVFGSPTIGSHPQPVRKTGIRTTTASTERA